MKSENIDKIYKLMMVKQPHGFSGRITVPTSFIRDLGLEHGSKLKYTRIENGFKVEKI